MIGVKEKMGILKKSSPEYPDALKEIHNAPKQLFVRGKLPKNCDMNFAIVGTRSASEYGKTLAFEFAKELAGMGFNIVSGLALGIDTQAHLGALAAGGKTIAVLGSPVTDEEIFPSSNRNLAKKIELSGGAIIGEHASGAKYEIWHFPERNRIISGLSRGVLVVEAPEKSGALITARLALDQNREVFAVPGPVFSKNSQGANNLIKNGAKMVTRVEDILEEFDMAQLKTKKEPVKEENLTEDEIMILNAVASEAVHIDKICKIIKLPVGRIFASLSSLEIKGVIKNAGGDKFVKIK